MSRSPSPFTNRQKLNRTTPAAADVKLGDLLVDVVTQLNALRADVTTLQAKLNADAGVTDTNYGAVDTSVAAGITTVDAR